MTSMLREHPKARQEQPRVFLTALLCLGLEHPSFRAQSLLTVPQHSKLA